MPDERWYVTHNPSIYRETIVLLSAVIYWGGVLINVYRVRSHIGKSPNLMKYKSLKEILMSLGWFIIIAGWIVQPLVVSRFEGSVFFSFFSPMGHTGWSILGTLLAVSGYLGTLWCYRAIGNSWRLGVNSTVKTELVKKGIYRYVRHPIYSFQIVILMGMVCLLPTLISLFILMIHFICISVMTRDEEAYLRDVHGSEYREYTGRAGRFFPRWRVL